MRRNFYRLVGAIIAATALIGAAPAVASVTLPAGVVQTDSRTFVQTQGPCSCVTSIDGYVFQGLPYVAAVGVWFDLYAQPGYVSAPAVTSISTTSTVSGTVVGGD